MLHIDITFCFYSVFQNNMTLKVVRLHSTFFLANFHLISSLNIIIFLFFKTKAAERQDFHRRPSPLLSGGSTYQNYT